MLHHIVDHLLHVLLLSKIRAALGAFGRNRLRGLCFCVVISRHVKPEVPGVVLVAWVVLEWRMLHADLLVSDKEARAEVVQAEQTDDCKGGVEEVQARPQEDRDVLEHRVYLQTAG